MKTRRLGNTDIHITPVGVGAWAIGGGGWQFGWGPQDDAESIAAIRAALEAGWNWIDTAAVYGLGHSETVVRRALEGVSPRPYVFTKCARIWDDQRKIGKSLKRDSVRRECEASLRRLGVDVIDLYQIHWPEPDEDVEEGWQTLAELKREGKIRWAGVSNFNLAQLQRASAIHPVSSLQPPYSIISPEIEREVLPWCRENNTGVLAYSPMKSGLLAGKMTRERVAAFAADDFRRNALAFQEPHLTRNLAIAEMVKEIGARYGRTAGEVAIAWVLGNPAVTGAIVGMRSPAQLEGLKGAADFSLPAEERERIAAFLAANPT